MYSERPGINTACHNGMKIRIFKFNQFKIEKQFKKFRGFGSTMVLGHRKNKE